MSYNRCKDTHKFGNKYLPSAYKTRVEFRSHFSGKKGASYSLRNTVRIFSRTAPFDKCDVFCVTLCRNSSTYLITINKQSC